MKIYEYEVNEIGKTGSSLKGYVNTTYDKLVSVLGKPSYTDADPYAKVSCEWNLTVKVEDSYDSDDYTYEDISIYSWKYGCIPVEECSWNVGGFCFESEDIAKAILDNSIEPVYSEVA
jgi:hypothetical protein